jgi:hypothetical protein
MSAYRDSRTPAEREGYDAAVANSNQRRLPACRERDLLAATEGTRAVAEAAYYPGHRLGSVEAIEAAYIERQERERRKQANAA